MSTQSSTASIEALHIALRGLLGGDVHLPGDEGYEEACGAWNAAVVQRPAAVVSARTAQQVSDVVLIAAAHGAAVTAQGTGHNAGPLDDLSEVVLIKTSRMTGVQIDPAARTARVAAGTLWLDVVEAAAAHGLTVLHGSSPDVGVLGYSLGGGMGWYARELGLQTNTLVAATVVTADGSIVRASREENPDLFWAIRGGGGNFGIVTEIEFRAFDFSDTYAGMMAWDWADAEPVLRAWASWSADAPRSVTTAFRILQLPPIPDIPEPLRGRNWVVIDGAVLADDDEAQRLVAPLRDLHPQIDTFARVPTNALIRLHMDPEGPTPVVSATAMLDELPDAGVKAFLDAAGPDSASSLVIAELRQLGGAIGEPAADGGALSHMRGQFLCFAAAMAMTPEMGAAGERDAHALVDRLSPWANGSEYLNFAESSIDTSRGYDPQTWLRLREVKTQWDPQGIVIGNHAIPPLAD